MNLTLFVVVLITAILLVVIAMSIARAISPRTFNKQKGEAYECGVPTRKIMDAIQGRILPVRHLVLMFDVETVFLYPWAVTVQDAGINGFTECIIFHADPYSGIGLRVEERSVRMEVKLNP